MNIKVAVEWTCGLRVELGRIDGQVTAKLPHRHFAIEPAKARLLAGMLTALAEYPDANPSINEGRAAL